MSTDAAGYLNRVTQAARIALLIQRAYLGLAKVEGDQSLSERVALMPQDKRDAWAKLAGRKSPQPVSEETWYQVVTFLREAEQLTVQEVIAQSKRIADARHARAAVPV